MNLVKPPGNRPPKPKRYQVGGRLGHGEMGVVYAAWDSKEERAVALKVYERDDEMTLSRVRRIVDRLRDLRHVNVVEIVELIESDKQPILVMERVDGEDLMSYCAGRWRSEPPAGGPGAAQVHCDLARLRSCLVQLASGLTALHRRGVVHKDVKPANLRVTAEGRLVILDFSLSDDHGKQGEAAAGTIAYMAPEQAITDGAVGPAADWYALGVILFEALTGRLPFDGPPQKILHDKALSSPPRVDELVAGAPADLVALCAALLVPEPDRRPLDAELAELLGLAERSRPSVPSQPPRPARQTRAIDRVLERMSDAHTTGRAAILALVGEPGIGKSDVLGEVRRAAHERWPDAIVLAVDEPALALDTIGAALAAAWTQLPAAEQASIVPRGAAALVELLPALARVPALAEASASPSRRAEHARATEAIDALRETLTLLSRRRPVVLLIDDLDELDRDASTVLADGLRAPDPPPVLLVGTCVDEAALPRIDKLSTVPLDWWPRTAINALLRARQVPAAMLEIFTGRSGGNPAVAVELARAHELGAPLADDDLPAILATRIARLSPAARDLLLARHLTQSTMPPDELAAALDLDPATAAAARDELDRAGIRATRRVRTAAASASTRDDRRRVARVLASHGELAAALRARLWHEAGEPRQGADHAATAAAAARARLRFSSATELYVLAIAGGRGDLELAHAECAAAARDGSAAARGFARAAARANGATRLALQVRAAEHHVLAGEVDDGIATFRTALRSVGIELAATPGRAIPRLLARRTWLRLRGMRFAPRPRSELAPLDLAALDACFSAALHVANFDTIIGIELHARATANAFRLGDPERMASAAALEAIFLATVSAGGRAQRSLELARSLAASATTKTTASFPLLGAAAIEYFHHHRFDRAVALGDTFLRASLSDPDPPVWTVDMARVYSIYSLCFLGDIHELTRRVHDYIREAERRGDRYASTIYRIRTPIIWLARGDADAADDAIATAERQWAFGGSSFRVPDFFRMWARIERALWAGDAATAAAQFDRDYPALQRSRLTRVNNIQIETDSIGARIAIAAAPKGQARSTARPWLARLARSQGPSGPAWADLLAGCAAIRDGEPAAAIERLRSGIQRADALHLGLLSSAARIRLGEARGNAYSDNAARGLHDLARLGVTDTARIVAMIAPT